LNEIIGKRKSVRKYDPAPLDPASLESVRAQFSLIRPLYPEIRYSIEITDKTGGLFNIKAPHYLVFNSEEKAGAFENIGFIGQQLDLFFSGTGLGSCWLGAAKPGDKGASDLSFVACMSFGKPAEPLHRELSEFKRKTLAEISEGSDERLEAARLAPSAVNAQNWFFVAGNGKIRCYRKKAGPMLGFIYNKLHCIDMGIALCHIAQGREDFSGGFDDFRFSMETGVPERKGYVYMGTVVD